MHEKFITHFLGPSVFKIKGNTVKRNAERLVQNVIKVPSKLIKLQQDVELAINIFFINIMHAFITTYSTKICFTMVTHVITHNKEHLWEALYSTYKIYLLRGFQIALLSGDQQFAALSELVGTSLVLPA